MCAYIQNEKAVAKSRMFPFRFYTAFDVLSDLEKFSQESYKEPKKNLDIATKKSLQNKMKKKAQMNVKAIQKFEEALNGAIQIATQKNIPALSGRTLILTSVGSEMKYQNMSKSAKSTKITSALEVSLLCAYMLESACEKVTWKSFGSDLVMQHQNASILQKVMDSSRNVTTVAPKTDAVFKATFLDMIRTSQRYDRIILVHGGHIQDFGLLMELLEQYRNVVNPECIYADVNVIGTQARFDADLRNVYMCGFSETMFHTLAKNSTLSELVDTVDKRYHLGTIIPTNSVIKMPRELESLESHRLQIRIFVSSTFKDMHGERNMMNNYIFPELTKRAKSQNIELTFVDLRWGITNVTAEKQVEICLNAIDKSQLFIGILADRYGWKPELQTGSRLAQKINSRIQGNTDLLYDPKMSMTEIEMLYNGFDGTNSFYFLRDDSVLSEIPAEFQADFVTFNATDNQRLQNLKDRVMNSGCQVMKDYPSRFNGVKNGVPILGNLESFGTRLLDTLWNALINLRNSPKEKMPSWESDMQKHFSFAHTESKEFINRPKIMQNIHETTKKMIEAHGKSGSLIELSAKEGFGATTILTKICDQMKSNHRILVLPFFSDALGQKRLKVSKFLGYLKTNLNELLGLEKSKKKATSSPVFSSSRTNAKSLAKDVSSLLQNASEIMNNANFKLVLILDGLLHLEAEDGILHEWLPSELSKGLFVIISTNPGSKLSRLVGYRADKQKTIQVDPLDLKERHLLAANYLQKYGKTLSEDAFDNQLNALIMKRESGNPTFLKVLCLELVKFGVFEKVSSQIQELGESLDSLLKSVCQRVESDLSRKYLEKVIPILIVSSDYGISESHLMTLFKDDHLTLSLLLNGLETFLETIGGKITVKAGHYFDVLSMKYCPLRSIAEAHKTLVKLYKSEYENAKHVDLGLLEALPYHLSALNDTKQLEELLCSLRFIQCSASSPRTFLSAQLHLNGAFLNSKIARERFASSPTVKAYSDFVIRYKDEMLAQPCLVPQLALNEPANSLIKADHWGTLTKPEYMLVQPDAQPSNLVSRRTFSSKITSFAIEQSDEIDPTDLLTAHGFTDGSIALSLAKSGTDLFTLLGHASPVTSVAFIAGSKSSGDSYLVSGSENGDLNFWDLNSRIRLKSFKFAHASRVTGIAVSYDGLTVVSVGWDGACKVWNGRGHRETSSLKVSSCPYNCVAYHPDKDYIITGDWEGLVKVWDLTSGLRKAVLRGHHSSVQAIVIASEATKVISADIDGKVCLFEGE